MRCRSLPPRPSRRPRSSWSVRPGARPRSSGTPPMTRITGGGSWKDYAPAEQRTRPAPQPSPPSTRAHAPSTARREPVGEPRSHPKPTLDGGLAVNPVLERLHAQRNEQLAAMDSVLSQVVDRDLVDAERSLLEATHQRVDAIDAQIKLLQPMEELRANAMAAANALPRPERVPAQPKRADGGDRLPEYRSAGHYLVDLIRARGLMGNDRDPEAGRRVDMLQARAVADQKTTDTA